MSWHVDNASRSRPPALPKKLRRIGSSSVEWFESEPGVAVILAEGGTVDDRFLAYVVTRDELAACGIRNAKFSFDGDPVHAGVPQIVVGPYTTTPARPGWELGSFGKGLISEDGEVYHWATGSDIDGYPFHAHAIEHLGLDRNTVSRFRINSDGSWTRYVRPQPHDDEMEHYVTQIPGVGKGPVPYGKEFASDDLAWEDSSRTSALPPRWRWPNVQNVTGPEISDSSGIESGQPWVYHIPSDTVYMGQPNWMHWDLIDSHPLLKNEYSQGYGAPRHPDFTHGRIQDGRNNFYGDWVQDLPELEPDQKGRINDALGVKPYEPIEENLWQDHSGSVRTSHWNDIMAKAKRLIQSGNVTLLRNGYNIIVAHVIGDHGEYTCEISRDDPNSRAITQWTCECPWDQFAFQRTRQWKKYEGRPCAHVLAAYWLSQGTPLDEDAPPGQGPQAEAPMGGPMAPQDSFQPRLPVEAQPGWDGGTMPLPPAAMNQFNTPPPSPGPYPPEAQAPMMFQNPADNAIIPPYPMDPAQLQLPVSVPGARGGPYPANPLQQPGTLSKVDYSTLVQTVVAGKGDEFPPGSVARLNEATLGQAEGREGATDAGQWVDIPRNSSVEVVYQDPSTGWVEVLYRLKGGAMTSYHARCFVEPEKLTPMGGAAGDGKDRTPTPMENQRWL